MRTTIDLPDDLHTIVSSLAIHQHRSLSRIAAELIRRGLESPMPGAAAQPLTMHPVTGLPLMRSPRVITPEDVKALDDDE